MNVKKHRFPVILLVFTLILAMLVSGLGWPGYMLPLLSPKSEKADRDNEEKAETVLLPQGNSKAFSVNPVKGVTISAEENALDKDREFKMEEVSGDEYLALLDDCVEVGEDMMIISAWELDAGLNDDEMLPGTFKMDFDLKELGIDEELYDDLSLFRIDDEGKWYEYATDIKDGVLSANSRQNSFIVITTAGCIKFLTAIGLLYVFAKTPEVSIGFQSGAYMTTWGVNEFDLYVDGGWRYRVLIDIEKVKRLIFDYSDAGKKAANKAEAAAYKEAMKTCINESNLPDDIKNEFCTIVDKKIPYSQQLANTAIKNFLIRYPEKEKEIKNISIKYAVYFKIITQQKLAETDEYKEYLKEMEKLKQGDPSYLDLARDMEGLGKMAVSLKNAWFFLKEQGGGLKMPTYKIDIHVADTPNKDSAAATVPATVGNPYMVVYLADHISGDPKTQYDELQLTIIHELFHVLQREYIFYYRANYGFDEMSAQMVEADAYDYMLANGTITTTSKHLDNMKVLRYFAIPLDQYSTEYPEGSIGKGKDGGRAETSYARAPFLRFLMGGNLDDANYTYHEIMSAYGATSGHSYMTTILKTCFVMNDNRLTINYHRFALDYQDKFYDYAIGCDDKAFAPIADLKGGKADVKLVNKNYTIRVRKVKLPKKKTSDKEFAVVLKYNDDCKTIMSDFEITPIGGLEEDSDYRNWDNGIFVDPRSYPEDEEKPGLYLMEVDGGTSSSEGYIYDDYSGYKLYALTAPEPKIEKKDGQMIIQPMKLDDYKKDVIDSVVITGMLGDKQVMRERIEYKGWDQPKTLDLNKLMKLDGEGLSEEDKEKVKFKVQECVIGTYEYDKPCLGPAFEDDTTSLDLTGTWELECEADYSSQMLDPIVEQYQQAVEQYGDLYGIDSISGLGDLADYYQQSKTGQKTKATMIIKNSGTVNEYDVIFKYDNDPNSVSEYHGSFNASKMQLNLKQKDTVYTDPDGKTYNLSEFGLLGEMNFTITINKDSAGKNELTIQGEGSVQSSIANVNSKMSGKKVSDKTD